MTKIEANTWVPSGNDFVIDSLRGRLGVQENFGETFISGATNGLALKETDNKVLLYAGSVNGGVHLRTYDKSTAIWEDRWEWVSKPGSGYTGSQSIGVLSISEDKNYIAVGQGNPSNFGPVGAPSQGIQIGLIKPDGTIDWLPDSGNNPEDMQGLNIRSMEWVGSHLVASSWTNLPGEFQSELIRLETGPTGIVGDIAITDKNAPNFYIDKGAGYVFGAGNYEIENSALYNRPSLRINDGTNFDLIELKTDSQKYVDLIGHIRNQGGYIARAAVHPELIDDKLIAFIGFWKKIEGKTPISQIIRVVINPATRELVDYDPYSVPVPDIGNDQASNVTMYGNFSLISDPNDPSGNSVFAGGNHFKGAQLSSPTTGGGLVRVDFSDSEPNISEVLYGPRFDSITEQWDSSIFPGQPHADSRTIAFYNTNEGQKLIQTDDGGIWELLLDTTPEGSKLKEGAWWQSLTSSGLNTLETNMVNWAAPSNSIASSYQDNASSLGYFGDDHAYNFWVGDGQLAFFDESSDNDSYSGYLSTYGYLEWGSIVKMDYTKDGFITSRQNSSFYLQQPNQTPIPWTWTEESLDPTSSKVFILPTEPNAYRENSIVFSGQMNIYETANTDKSLPDNAINLRPLIKENIESLKPSAIDNQGSETQGEITSLYVGASDGSNKPVIYGRSSKSADSYFLNKINLEAYPDFASLGGILDLAHSPSSNGDVLYWLQGGRRLTSRYVTPGVGIQNQYLSIMKPDGSIISKKLDDFGIELITQGDYGYQVVVFVPKNQDRSADLLVIGGNKGIWSVELDDEGIPVGNFERMAWLGLPDEGPGSYIKTMQYDPQDDLLIAGTQGQGSFIYSFSGDLGMRPTSDKLLHISNIDLVQNYIASIDKRGNQQNSTIVIQLDSLLQDKNATTEVEITLHDVANWRQYMELVSLYDISLGQAGEAAKLESGFLNLLDPKGLEYANGTESDDGRRISFNVKFPPNVSLFNLIINQKEQKIPGDDINLQYSVRTIDGLNNETATVSLIANPVTSRAIFNGSSLDISDSDYYRTEAELLVGSSIEKFVANSYKASSVLNSYTATPVNTRNQETRSSNELIRTTIPIDTFNLLKSSESRNIFSDEPEPLANARLYSVISNVDGAKLDTEQEKLKAIEEGLFHATYDPIADFGTRFYDFDNNKYADHLSTSANAAQNKFTTEVNIGFGSVLVDPKFQLRSSQSQVYLTDQQDLGVPVNVRLFTELSKQSNSTSSFGYILLSPDESISQFNFSLFRERSRSLISSLGKSVDLSAMPEGSNFANEILVNNGQSLIIFEVDGASLDQLTGVDDPRLKFLDADINLDNGSDLDGNSFSFTSSNGAEATVTIHSGFQGLNPLIADQQTQAPVLDFTAFSDDQLIDFTFGYGREAGYDSVTGFYYIDQANGAITADNGDTLLPGDSDYVKQALRSENLSPILSEIFIDNMQTSLQDLQIYGGVMLAPYAKVSNNGETYFAYGDANSDGLQHFQSLGTNLIGFEDLKGGGDRDFQDAVFNFDFTNLVTI